MVRSSSTPRACARPARALRRCPDIERALSRLSLGRGGPRDLAAVRDALGLAGELRALLRAGGPPPCLAAALGERLGLHETLVDRLRRALAAELPLLARDGGFIAAGYDDEPRRAARLRDDSRR
jgi:DNA mismatch repair protein MutS